MCLAEEPEEAGPPIYTSRSPELRQPPLLNGPDEHSPSPEVMSAPSFSYPHKSARQKKSGAGPGDTSKIPSSRARMSTSVIKVVGSESTLEPEWVDLTVSCPVCAGQAKGSINLALNSSLCPGFDYQKGPCRVWERGPRWGLRHCPWSCCVLKPLHVRGAKVWNHSPDVFNS